MPLPTGTAIGPYEILGQVGAGGMGEVYKARDNRIGREVAIKVLPETFARDPEWRRRFESEVRTTGALNHPNILAIFDVGEHDGSPYIVSEFLVGETVRERIDQGPFTTRKAVEYGLAIAHGLAAAHEKKVVHRDLKPENLFLTRDGRIKIIDFGLAKVNEQPPVQQSAPTRVAGTLPGVVLGTVGYMSPEQVRGLPADHRTDIFAFGAVLYEMLTGRRAFQAPTPAETMTAILKEEPAEFANTPATVPPGLERVIRHCLEKAPEQRFQSAADLAFALDALSSHSTTTSAALPALEPAKRKPLLLALAGITLMLAIGAGVYAAGRSNASTSPVTPIRFSLATEGPVVRPAVAPDGKAIAYSQERPDRRGIWIRRLDNPTAISLPGADGSPFMYPSWSPDSSTLFFTLNSRLLKVGLPGGAVEPIGSFDAPSTNYHWGSSGEIVFTHKDQIQSISAKGGEPRTVYRMEPPFTSYFSPKFLADGRHIVFAARPGNARAGVYLGSLDGARPERIADIDNVTAIARHLGDDYLIYPHNQVLWAQRLNSVGKPVREPVRLTQTTLPVNQSFIGLTAGGSVIAWLDIVDTQNQLTWFDRAGRRLGALGKAGPWTNPVISPDASRVAVNGPGGVWVIEPERDLTTRVVQRGSHPVWMADGRRILHKGTAADLSNIFASNANGTGEPVQMIKDASSKWLQAATTDERFLLYVVVGSVRSLYAAPVEPGAAPLLLFSSARARNLWATTSPDGKWLLLCHDDSGSFEIYIQPFQPGAPAPEAARLQVSTEGGVDPKWSPDGKRVYFLTPDARKLMAVEVQLGANPKVSKPQLALEAPFAWTQTLRNSYDISRDGQKILAAIQVEQQDRPIQVLANWQAALPTP